ncbi:hypothetical protein HK098_001216 [Nowakowskiella sp. JEL0407]|nr:hypothetical protein HK098_001216 [Nowakowskiella sp. JEL0407]
MPKPQRDSSSTTDSSKGYLSASSLLTPDQNSNNSISAPVTMLLLNGPSPLTVRKTSDRYNNNASYDEQNLGKLNDEAYTRPNGTGSTPKKKRPNSKDEKLSQQQQYVLRNKEENSDEPSSDSELIRPFNFHESYNAKKNSSLINALTSPDFSLDGISAWWDDPGTDEVSNFISSASGSIYQYRTCDPMTILCQSPQLIDRDTGNFGGGCSSCAGSESGCSSANSRGLRRTGNHNPPLSAASRLNRFKLALKKNSQQQVPKKSADKNFNPGSVSVEKEEVDGRLCADTKIVNVESVNKEVGLKCDETEKSSNTLKEKASKETTNKSPKTPQISKSGRSSEPLTANTTKTIPIATPSNEKTSLKTTTEFSISISSLKPPKILPRTTKTFNQRSKSAHPNLSSFAVLPSETISQNFTKNRPITAIPTTHTSSKLSEPSISSNNTFYQRRSAAPRPLKSAIITGRRYCGTEKPPTKIYSRPSSSTVIQDSGNKKKTPIEFEIVPSDPLPPLNAYETIKIGNLLPILTSAVSAASYLEQSNDQNWVPPATGEFSTTKGKKAILPPEDEFSALVVSKRSLREYQKKKEQFTQKRTLL